MTNTLNQALTEQPAIMPRHTQRAPEAWDQLIANTQQLIESHTDKSGVITRAAATASLKMVQMLPDEDLEANRYYSQGIVTCEVMRSIGTSAGRDLVVTPTREAIRKHSVKNYHERPGWPERGIRVQDIKTVEVARTIFGLLPLVHRRLDPAHNLIVDSLVVAENERRHAYRYGEEPEAETFEPNQGYGVSQVVDSLFAGALLAYGRGLELEANFRRKRQEPMSDNPLVRDLTDISYQLQPKSLLRATMYATKLRFDEFGREFVQRTADDSEWLTVDEAGELTFDVDRLKTTPPLPADKAHSIHDTRLGCPAAYIVGAVPTVMKLVPEIVAQADFQVTHPLRSRLGQTVKSHKS